MSLLRRARGFLLRLAFRRVTAVVAGLALVLPSAWLIVGDFRWESGVTDGLALICGATGVALLFIGLGGRSPDWVDGDSL
jgi:hypothetical protein